jgi:hypothetical protein
MKKDLVRVSTFATLTGQTRQKVYKWCEPQKIEPDIEDETMFIDLNKYKPEDFKK